MSTLISPHGGHLVNRILTGDERAETVERAAHLPRLPLDPWSAADLELIGTGVVSPLTGFMDQETYNSVVDHLHLPGGLPFSLPIMLSVTAEQLQGLDIGQDVALSYEGRLVGLLRLESIFPYDKVHEAKLVFGTTDAAHPGVQRLYSQGDFYLSGPIWLLDRRPADFPDLALDPAATRRIFAEKGWRRVVGFQTRNPVHRAHEYIQKVAMETVDGLFLNPLVGQTKSDDVPAPVRVRAYKVLLANYYPPNRTVLGAFPAAMRYAGPREAVFHAICRKNYGCSHFIVGRDHAGVGSYYGTYAAQEIFKEFRPEALGIAPIFFENTFYCHRCASMASEKTCPHSNDDRVILSGTKVREMLRAGTLPPPEFSRPEVAQVLIAGLQETAAD